MSFVLPDKETAFKEYDIRGIYPDEVDEELARMVAKVLAEKVFKKGKVVVGRDGRHSSPALSDAVITVFEEHPNLKVIDAGLITTPALYFLVNDLDASGGIMVTASHNAKEFNGLKVVGRKAEFLGGKEIYKLLQ